MEIKIAMYSTIWQYHKLTPYMDYMDLDVRCLRKGVKLNSAHHTLAIVAVIARA